LKTAAAKGGDRVPESLHLIICQWPASSFISSCEMRHQSVDANIRKPLQHLHKLDCLIKAHTQATHAGVDLYVHVGHDSGRSCRLVQCFDQIKTIDHRRQSMLQASRLLPFPKSAQTKDRLDNSGLSQFDRFFRGRHSEPSGATVDEPVRTFNCAMTVRIRLHDGHYFDLRPDQPANDIEVGSQCVEINLSPGWTMADSLDLGVMI